jgi:hypothetical protein
MFHAFRQLRLLSLLSLGKRRFQLCAEISFFLYTQV